MILQVEAGALERDIVFRVLRPADVGAVHALHLDVFQALPDRSFMYERNVDYFLELLEGRGMIIGASQNGSLMCYAAFTQPGASGAGYADQLRPLGVNRFNASESAGSAVHPAYRRKGVYRKLMRERFNSASAIGIQFMTMVVSPQNSISLRVCHGLGCAAAGCYIDADGENFLMLKPLNCDLPVAGSNRRIVPLKETQRHLQHLRGKGQIGLPAWLSAEPAFAYEPLSEMALPWKQNS